MRLVTLRTAQGTCAGRLDALGPGSQLERVVELPYPDVGAVLASGEDWAERIFSLEGPGRPLEGVHLAPVVPKPSKIICLGLNYRAHVEELGREPPRVPTLFAKFSEALIGPTDPIVLPFASRSVDWEGELVILVGRRARHASEDEAAAAIAGFCVGNDVSVRDWQRRSEQWLQGKTWESTTPVGPALVTPDEVGGPAPDLRLVVTVDDAVVQDDRTSKMVFGPPAIVTYISTVLTLEPGDMIFTGTPGGVGEGRSPQVFLRVGQLVRTQIEGIGELVNRCVAEALPKPSRES